MRKILFFICIVFFISFVSGSSSFATTSDGGGQYCATPPFVTTASITPNILIILDNSNSMDEDFNGAAVGSGPVPGTPSATSYTQSRSEIARHSILNIIDTYKDKMRFGLMAYKQKNISLMELHNAYYYASYDSARYDPNFDFQGASTEDTTKKRYKSILNFDDDSGSETIYYNKALPYYSDTDDHTRFLYRHPRGSNIDCYYIYKKKTGQSDNEVGYANYTGDWWCFSDRKSTRLNSSHIPLSRMPSSA